ncbi:DUF2600 domain-containing protein [Halalkalibacillus sediminis]|uniref:DUF2600 domain-containing protein n=1 Tax=Halalkalibacillus sediminis TaxID=2018042 RepID=A0A2I0QUW7_9BACI|nr:tetraprenyl-beta-curcumene synthase family protein [Halalkalibacillus sediminis]PKR78147.1 DUF2600 domain-containing protein [Halalkalibacillus sediminis]
MRNIPTSLTKILSVSYRKIFPQANEELDGWRKLAEKIPNDELRTQALESIDSKTFHCEGGSIYAVLARENWEDAISFIVAYQTISDYLDNLCDRSTSLDPEDFRQLHLSMLDAISPNSVNKRRNYYQFRDEQDDGEYLASLVATCQEITRRIKDYERIYPTIHRLAGLYIDLQVHKHVRLDERVPRLEEWFNREKDDEELFWYEFSAATGSTIGIFCLISYGLDDIYVGEEVYQSYFPYMQGLHILLDYFIDQKEDEVEGDLNFCHYYESEDILKERFEYMIKNAREGINGIPDPQFHEQIVVCLVGLYLSDRKVNDFHNGKEICNHLLRKTGWKAKFIYWNGKGYRKVKKRI